MEAELNNFKIFDDLIEFFDGIYPIGYVKEQYPGQPSPNELWGDYSVWEELDYHGAFFSVYEGDDSNFETKLSVQSVNNNVVVFTSNYSQLESNRVIYDYKHNEARLITGLGGSRTVYIDTPFSNTDITEVIISEGSAFAEHSHSISHTHSAGSTTSVSSCFVLDINCNNRHYISQGTPGNDSLHLRSYSVSCGCGYMHSGGYVYIRLSVGGATTSTSVDNTSTTRTGTTSNTGDTRPINFTYKLWRRIS